MGVPRRAPKRQRVRRHRVPVPAADDDKADAWILAQLTERQAVQLCVKSSNTFSSTSFTVSAGSVAMKAALRVLQSRLLS